MLKISYLEIGQKGKWAYEEALSYVGNFSYYMNWGWSAYYNGYFRLSALNPGSYSFNDGQGMIIGIKKAETNKDDVSQLRLTTVTAIKE